MTPYANCDVISAAQKKIQTEISHEQRVSVQKKRRRTCITVLHTMQL